MKKVLLLGIIALLLAGSVIAYWDDRPGSGEGDWYNIVGLTCPFPGSIDFSDCAWSGSETESHNACYWAGVTMQFDPISGDLTVNHKRCATDALLARSHSTGNDDPETYDANRGGGMSENTCHHVIPPIYYP